jgi:hypothetical protein
MGAAVPVSEADEASTIRAFLREINDLRDANPDLAVVQARRAIESLCQSIRLQTTGQRFPGRPSLEKMATELENNGSIPGYISASIRTVQRFGNLGAHSQSGLHLTSFAIAPCLQALATVCRWHLETQGIAAQVPLADLDEMYADLAQAKLERRTREERLSFGLSLEGDDGDVNDFIHHYLLIRRIDILDSRGGDYRSHRWLTIENASDKPSLSISHLEAGENKIRYEQLAARACLSDHNGKRLAVDSITLTQPSFTQKIRICFDQPLLPGASLTLYYRLRWPGEAFAYADGDNSQSISLVRYRQGVDRVEFGVLGNVPVASVRATRIDRNFEEIAVQAQPVYMTAEDDDRLAPLHGKGLSGFTFPFDAANTLAFRVLYRPGMDDFTSADDEF